jgi:hypothetical protein
MIPWDFPFCRDAGLVASDGGPLPRLKVDQHGTASKALGSFQKCTASESIRDLQPDVLSKLALQLILVSEHFLLKWLRSGKDSSKTSRSKKWNRTFEDLWKIPATEEVGPNYTAHAGGSLERTGRALAALRVSFPHHGRTPAGFGSKRALE